MKRLNKNSLVFVFCMLFIAVGLFSVGFKDDIVSESGKLLKGKSSVFTRINMFVDNVDRISTDDLLYHDLMMDVFAVKENIMGTRVVEKKGETVVKTDSGSLTNPTKKLEKSTIDDNSNQINRLRTVSEENGAQFLYCIAPGKNDYEKLPDNVDNYSKENHDSFLSSMDQYGIPYLDFADMIKDNGFSTEDTYFYTDHHWKPYIGFTAAGEICRELNKRYGFSYDESLTDISNYNVDTYHDWFLGSWGKKVGLNFTWHGADDFDLITPRFKTDLVEQQPIKDESREGPFEDTVLFMDNMNKNYYGRSAYSTYCGGDYRLQIIRNKLNPKGKKILLIRDSYACVVAPFLSLQTSELHICDMRNYENHVGEKLNAEEYIKEIKPDYVLVLYSRVPSGKDGLFDFF